MAVILGSILLWFFLIPVIGLTGAFIFRQLEHPDREYGKIRVWGTLGWMAANWTLTAWFKYSPGLFGGETSTPADLADSMRLGGLAAFAVALFALTLPHAPPSPVSDDAHNRRSRLLRLVDAPLKALCMFRERSFVVYCACMFGFYITFPFTIQLNPLLLDHAGINRSELPLGLTICQCPEVVLLVLLPMLLMRFGLKATMVAGALAWTVGLATLAVGTPTALVLAGLSAGGMFICCFVISGQVFVNRQATHDIRASAQGLLIFINGIGLLLGHFLVGWLRRMTDDNFNVAYLIAAIISAALFFLFAAGFSTPAPAESPVEPLVPEMEMP